ncbi:hypothetical protein Y919_09610 [Caloranaerobacter azorensis H53214]|uniref:DUF1848 domain-containing protein n=1 Tax=Caloranaerobacter azorensis H53214 TaxID=1156417 RepID=A0A096BGE9_9FIRM|nr:DUF1848 domain-containing protein [Caloranaerobacter azorensis]KGG79828.1 hypothetical protein Y919_09610 [Caloranaerobacter azorensis H53214]
MIISASRRTDIPAFYSEWFLNRIKEGYLLVRNPMNYHQVSKIILDPNIVDCIVFWTKNPKNMIDKLPLLKDYKYYFQFTITSYDSSIETNVPRKKEIIETFIRLSNIIGKDRVIWRYDPILLNNKINEEYHYKYFEYLASKLYKYTNKCIISFLDMYKKTRNNIKYLNIKPLYKKDMIKIASGLMNICNKYNLKLETCAEEIELNDIGITHGKCIDDRLISKLWGINLKIDKDKNQRKICGCVSSIDIGTYNTCIHGCLYCYANFSEKSVKNNLKKHNPNSPLLLGNLEETDKIFIKKIESYRDGQLSF